MSVSPIHHLADKRLAELGIILPPLPQPVANYVPFTIGRNLLFMSGQGPRTADHAQNGLSTVRRVVKITGFVNASDDFRDHPK
jgi:enamine deaminase RidA (YjgF/YER057c/UK114 family)